MDFQTLTGFLVAVGIGVLIGLEREMEIQQKKLKDFLGVRTFALISLFGAVMGFLVKQPNLSQFVLIGFAGFIMLIIANHIVRAIEKERKGVTTEFSAFLAFILGFMSTLGYYSTVLPIAILVIIFLAFKKPLHEFAARIKAEEVYATIKFAIVALVILPFLPNKNFTPLDIPNVGAIVNAIPFFSLETIATLDVFNPYRIWLMVVFISGISFVGYVLIKTIGADKGLGITGFLGGLVSSTAVTSSLSLESKRLKRIAMPAVFGVVIACSTMFARIIIEITVFNASLLRLALIPLLAMAIVGIIAAFFVWKRISRGPKHKMDFASPFALGPALKFALFFAFVLFISKLGQVTLGTKGIIIAAIISGLADVDAITLTMANLALVGDITAFVAVAGITVAAVTNTIVKGAIAYIFGSREYSKWVITIFTFMTGLGLLTILLI